MRSRTSRAAWAPSQLIGLVLASCCLISQTSQWTLAASSSQPGPPAAGGVHAPNATNGSQENTAMTRPIHFNEFHELPRQQYSNLIQDKETTATSQPADEASADESGPATAGDPNSATNSQGSTATTTSSNSSDIVELSAFEAARLGYYRHPPLTSVVLTVAYTIVFVIGIVGNSFVVAIVCKSPRMRTVTNYFIVNLAFADILVLLFCLPATLIGNLFIPYVLGLFVCKTVSYLQGIAVGASINTMVTVTLDRFLAICFPMDWHMSRRTARWVIACIWLFSALISAPWAVYFTLVPYPLDNITIQVCSEDWPSERIGAIYFVCANLILLYLFPATVIILCYLGIWYKIERRNIPGDRPQGLKIELIMQKSKIKVIKMMMFVVFIFLLSWAPTYLIFTRIKLASERSPWEERLINYMMPLAQWLGASNSCINPILYTFFNRKYKRGFFDLFRFAFCCDPSMKYERRAQAKAMTTNGTEFVRLDGTNSITMWNLNAQNNANNNGNQTHSARLNNSENSNSTRVTNSQNETNSSSLSKNGSGRSRRQIGFKGNEQSSSRRTLSAQTLGSANKLSGTASDTATAKRAQSPQINRADTTPSSSSSSAPATSRLTGRRLSAGLPSLGNNSSMATTTTTIEEEDQKQARVDGAGPVSLYQSSSNVATTSIDCDDLHDDDDGDHGAAELKPTDGDNRPSELNDNIAAGAVQSDSPVRAKCHQQLQTRKKRRKAKLVSRSSGHDDDHDHLGKLNDGDNQIQAKTAKLNAGDEMNANKDDGGLAGSRLNQLNNTRANMAPGDDANRHREMDQRIPRNQQQQQLDGNKSSGSDCAYGDNADSDTEAAKENQSDATTAREADLDEDDNDVEASDASTNNDRSSEDVNKLRRRRRRRRRKRTGDVSGPQEEQQQSAVGWKFDGKDGFPDEFVTQQQQQQQNGTVTLNKRPQGGLSKLLKEHRLPCVYNDQADSLFGQAVVACHDDADDYDDDEPPSNVDKFDMESGVIVSGTSLAELFLQFFNNNNNVHSTQSQNQLASSGANQMSSCDNDKSWVLSSSKSCVDLSKRKAKNKSKKRTASNMRRTTQQHQHQQHVWHN